MTSTLRRGWNILLRAVSMSADDDIFFMAGAITFNLLVAVAPLILLLVGISGFVLSSRFPEPSTVLIPFIVRAIPELGGELDLAARVERIVDALVEERAGFSLAGALVFLWISTRLVGTLRVVLRQVFDLSESRGIIQGKLFDGLMVVVGGVLFTLNLGLTLLVTTIQELGVGLVGLEGAGLTFVRQLSAQLLAFASIWVLFALVYRYLPPRLTPWRTSLVAATFTAVLFEATKYAFSWYVTSVADYRTVYGGLTSAAVLFFWIYYVSIVFILGGEVGQAYAVSRARKLHASTLPR